MPISFKNIKNNAHQFVIDYARAVKENSESQSFLNDFFAIFGINRRRVASFETPVKVDGKSTKRIDLFWQGVLLVEMKSTGQDLNKAYQQGIGYFKGLTDEQLPRYVMVCDLNTFKLYDLDDGKDYQFILAELPQNLHLFDFMQGKQGQDISEYQLNEQAALLLGELHDTLEESGFTGHELQIFMVRILFCLFAEDTGVFERHQFTRYLLQFTDEFGFDTELHLHKLFQVLDKNQTTRNKNLTDELQAFPYVNGHLFKERIDLPSFTKAMRDQLIECCLFNWKEISPAIFGSLFQSIMNKENRRSLGAHYTSETNILRTIQPLFLTELQQQITKASKLKNAKQRNQQLIDLMAKVRQLSFLDPACGCGNFLIITYRELRRLELQLLQAQQQNQQQAHIAIEIEPQIPLNNFYGIEIDEWPARIAEVAMWLTQHQMNLEFAKAFGKEPDLLPLTATAQIHQGDALAVDWNEVIKAKQLDYIIGNPPFVGKNYRSNQQNQAMEQTFLPSIKKWRSLDFVASWLYKSAVYSKGKNTNIALVTTNSITMGEQVSILWQPILDLGYQINFAHRTFAWSNEASGKGAAVHCVIIGFSQTATTNKILFDYADIKGEPTVLAVDNINPYLIDAPDIVIQSRSKPICKVSEMVYGNKPVDGGFLLLNQAEKEQLCQKSPGGGLG